MKTAHTVITLLLALAFLVAGLSKASGSNAGLSGTRDVGFPDGGARLIGIIEILASLSLILGFAFDNATLEKYGYVAILVIMAGAIYFHFRANKMKTAFPAFFFLILSTIGIFTSKL